MLSDGRAGLRDHIGATLMRSPELAGHAALGGLTVYLAAHAERLNYGHRPFTGRSIGSGMVEGAAENMIGRRLVQTGARWEVENVNRMAGLCCLTSGDHRDVYRASPTDCQNPTAYPLQHPHRAIQKSDRRGTWGLAPAGLGR